MNRVMERDLKEILDTALAAAEPGKTVRRFLSTEGGCVRVGDDSFEPGRVFVLAVGKASGPMARATGEILGEALSDGLCVIKDGHEEPPEPFETVVAGHPEPDEGSVRAAEKAEELLESLEEEDLLLVLVSGGASALLADVASDIGLEDLKKLNGALLRSGAEIGEINTVRKHVSTLKGGNLVRRAAPAHVVALLLSDVVGDEPSSIGSRLTASAAAEKARTLGYEPLLLTTYLTGDARDVAGLHAAVMKEILESGNPLPPPCAIVTGGEATVVVRGEGTGGPNQEFALALAVELEGVEGWAALAVDTDGADGSTDAAGGLATGETATAIRESDVDPAEALDENDSYNALKAGGALLSTGATGTNVNDLRVALVSGETRR